MPVFFGIIAAVISGALNGSFAVPMKRTTKWEWENVWLLYAVTAMIILPLIIALCTVPQLLAIYNDTPAKVLVRTFLFGIGWGLGSVTFGLGLHMAGLSLGYTILIGVIAVTGSLIPMLIHDPGSLLLPGGIVIILAMLVTIAGAALCGTAGAIREKEKQKEQTKQDKSYKFKWAFLVCIASGILSAMLNLAFDFGAPIAQIAETYLAEQSSAFRANNPVWLLILYGGFIPNFLYCAYLMIRKGSWKRYIESGTGSYWLWGILMGTVWMGCIVSYGVGASSLGKLGTTVGWLILMAVTVLVGNLWGVITGEWQQAPKKARRRMLQGFLLLVGSVMLVGLGRLLLG
jgi:L-rhamnose-H+ transport protein